MTRHPSSSRGRIALVLAATFAALSGAATAPDANASGTGSPALVIGGGAHLRLKPATRLTLDCDLKNFGTFTPAAGSGVVVNGYGSPALRGVAAFADLQMASHGVAWLANDAAVNGLLTLTSGKLSLAGNDLYAPAISGGSAGSYVVTPDTLGQLVRGVGHRDPVNFPVGNSAYNPAAVRLETGVGVMRVGVIDDANANGLAPAAHLSRSWLVRSNSGPTDLLQLFLQWNDGEQGPAFQRDLAAASGERAWRWDGASWQAQPGVLTGDNGQIPAVVELTSATPGLWTLASAGYSSGVETAILPTALQLDPVWPNPVRDNAVVRFGMPRRGNAKVCLYSVRGERVAVLFDGNGDAGWHSAQVDSRRIASGVYFLRLESGDKVVSRKVMVVR